jgi:hypothetical protein
VIVDSFKGLLVDYVGNTNAKVIIRGLRPEMRNNNFQGKGQALLGRLSRLLHRLSYGLSLRYADASTEKEILDNIHLHYQGEDPFEIVRFNTPVQHKEWSFDGHLFIEDLITFRNLASLSLGLHLVSTTGSATRLGTQPEIPSAGEPGLGQLMTGLSGGVSNVYLRACLRAGCPSSEAICGCDLPRRSHAACAPATGFGSPVPTHC